MPTKSLNPAAVVFGIPELRNKILFTFVGLQSPAAAAIAEATCTSYAQCGRAAGGSKVQHGNSPAAKRHTRAVQHYVHKRDHPPACELPWFLTPQPLWRVDYLKKFEAALTPSVAELLRCHAPDYAEQARWHFLLRSGGDALAVDALMKCWRSPKPCGIGLTVRYVRSRLIELARDACPTHRQPDPTWSKAAIVRHILAH